MAWLKWQVMLSDYIGSILMMTLILLLIGNLQKAIIHLLSNTPFMITPQT